MPLVRTQDVCELALMFLSVLLALTATYWPPIYLRRQGAAAMVRVVGARD